ncbi:MAG: hypothetical protein ACLFUL_13190 [Desulfobacteraceae bacterium]
MSTQWPSVTQVLSVFSDFSRIPPDVLQRAAARGTEVHGLCAAIAKGLYSVKIPEGCGGYVNSFRSWFKNVQDVLLVETRLKDPVYQYHGTPDLVVRLKGDSTPRLIDLKTPAALGLLWAAQIAAYERLFTANGGMECAHSGTLRLKPDGGRALFDECRHSAQDLHAFLCALTAYRNFKQEEPHGI